MRISFDTLNFNINGHSGNQTYTRELIKALCRISPANNTWQPITYWRKKKACSKELGEHKGLKILNIYPHPKLLGNHLTFLVKSCYPILNRFVERNSDLIHCTNPMNYPFGVKNAVTTIHDLIALRHEPWVSEGTKSFYKKHIGSIVSDSLFIFADSAFTRNEILERFPETEQKVLEVPLAANPKYRLIQKNRSFLNKYGIADNEKPYLLTVGEIQPRKNIQGAISSFESIAHSKKDLRLFIIGQTRKDYLAESILKRVKNSSVGNRIILLHHVQDEDLVHFYNNALGFLYFSFYEGFGLPVIEAMQCGCPVVASNATSIKEIAEGAALLADPYNENSMCESVKQLLEDDSLRSELIKKGLQRASTYSWDKTAELTLEGYEKVMRSISK